MRGFTVGIPGLVFEEEQLPQPVPQPLARPLSDFHACQRTKTTAVRQAAIARVF